MPLVRVAGSAISAIAESKLVYLKFKAWETKHMVKLGVDAGPAILIFRGEYLGSAAGLGYIIQQAEGVFDVAGVFAGMFVLAVFVIVIDMIVTAIEKRLLVWRPVAAMDAR